MNKNKGEPLHILVTRPGQAGEDLCQQIAAGGEIATYFPTIAFGPPLDAKAMQAAIAKLGEQDWLIFISPRAVYASVVAIRKTWPVLPETVKFAVMGSGTAKALKEAGYQADIQPEHDWGSEGLLDAPALQALEGKKVALIRGEGGRELLDKIFHERGAEVTHVIVYERQIPEVDASDCAQKLKLSQIDAIMATSFEGVRNLLFLLGEDVWLEVSKVPLIVASDRIKSLAADLGFQTIWVAKNASNEAMLALLAQKKEALCQIKSTNY